MKERPVIFNAEMVRAILDGRKTQTRRPVKFPFFDKNLGCELAGNELAGEVRAGNLSNVPFGRIGDRLWVREAFGMQVRRDGLGGTGEFRVYRASNPDAVKYTTACGKSVPVKWTPSIHMPRWACRILLEITAVRVERLSDIRNSDAVAEGVEPLRGGYWRHYQPGWTQHQISARGSFVTLWKSIYGADSWDANPWVWVIEFKRVGGSDASK
ncbi:hypothetical protein SERVES_01678 [Serratia ficaria]|uniref:hypothetical protein n=1 Tax=Serratia ficaria TaxID=61651 RepID=UPI0011996431|nr:hypothetical protein [Serratia ficaria]VVA47957.1 hypothetical protein SERVES_01678 [Serratia ficaria]